MKDINIIDTIRAGNYALVGSVFEKPTIKIVDNEMLYKEYNGDIEIEPIELNEKWLLDFKFEKTDSLILDSYSISISDNDLEYKTLSVTIEKGNQYVLIRQGDTKEPRHKDNVVTLFNGDKQGDLFVHIIQNIYYYLTFKKLKRCME